MSTKTAVAGHPHLLPKLHQTAHTWLGRAIGVARVLAIIVLIVAALSMAAQLLYPSDRTLPLMQIGGLDVGFKTKQAVTDQLTDYAQTGQVTLQSPSRQWQEKWQSMGVTVDPDASTQAALDYQWWERLLPFTSIIKIVQSHQLPLVSIFDEDQLQSFVKQLVADDQQAAREGVVSVKDGQVKIDQAKNGYKFVADDVEEQIKAAPMTAHATLKLTSQPVPFVHSQDELNVVAAQANAMLGTKLSLKIADQTYQPTRAQVGQWLSFGENSTTHKLAVDFAGDKIAAYLVDVTKSVIKQPGTSTVTLLDGQEVGRTPADAGQTVATDQAVTAIEAKLKSNAQSATVNLPVVSVPPNVNYVRTYSQQNSGLEALITDWEKATPGTYGIIVRELDGDHRYADFQPDYSFVTASTYKMFIAYDIMHLIEQGQLTWDQKNDMGWTLRDCMNEMILHSTNPCAISFMNLLGWQHAEDMIHDAGFPNTFVNNQGPSEDKHSTVRDETNFMMRLQAGTLLSPENSDYLLGLMKRQIWRSGIPAGVPKGTTVADKVGFYNGYQHDIAIVYGPKHTYLLGIMSRWATDPELADLSRKVYDYFNN